MRDFLAEEGTKGIHLEALPGYAPAPSPLDQGCWRHLKSVEMANLSCLDMEELHPEFDLYGMDDDFGPFFFKFYSCAILAGLASR